MEHEGNDYANRDWCFRYSNKMIIERIGGLGSYRTSGEHPNYSIVKNGQNSEKSPGDLRRLVVTQTQMGKHKWVNINKMEEKSRSIRL